MPAAPGMDRRGLAASATEVAAEAVEGKQSRVWDEAGNRLHAQKAIMAVLMGGETLS